MLSPHSYPTQRAPRVKLAGSVLVLLQQQDCQPVRARLHQLSINGGLLQISQALDVEIPIEVMFHLRSTTVRARAQTIFPIWATKGCFQPFRFTALSEEDRRKLDTELQALIGREEPVIDTGTAEETASTHPAGPTEVVLYFDRSEDALHFTVALSSVIFSDTRGREDVVKLGREISKISRVTTKAAL